MVYEEKASPEKQAYQTLINPRMQSYLLTFLEKVQTLEQTKQAWINQWFNKSGSSNSKHGAQTSLKWFERYVATFNKPEEEIINELRIVSLDHTRSTQLYLFINGLVQYLKEQDKATRSIRIYIMFVKSYLRFHGIKIYNDDIKQFVNFPKLIRERRQPLTEEMIIKLLQNASPKYQVIILCLVSSGARISEWLQAKVSDLDLNSNPVKLRIRAETTKTREERETFITNQAKELLVAIIKDKTEKDFIFFKDFTQCTLPDVETVFRDIRERCGFNDTYTNGIHHVTIHSFRAYCFTKLVQRVGENYAHALLGHHAYLDQYFRETLEERSNKYKIVEPDLTIKF